MILGWYSADTHDTTAEYQILPDTPDTPWYSMILTEQFADGLFGDDGMAPDKDGTRLYFPNLSFCQEITRAYALVQQH